MFPSTKGEKILAGKIFSIISNRDEIDASKLAEPLGGGGHVKVSAASVTYNDVMYDEINNVWTVTLKKYEKSNS